MKNITGFIAICSAVALLGGCAGDDKNPADSNTGPFPILVSNNFVPSGYMGDVSGIIMTTSGCKSPRAAGAGGDCYKIEYTPGGLGWGGVFWQSPANNWGGMEGKSLEPGATKITFFAAADADGQAVDFFAGGINNDLTSGTYGDSFKATTKETLGTAWKQFTLDLAGATYGKVLGGFGYSLAGTGTEKIVFYVDDIKWVK